jgi:hypothetical protein
MVGRAWIYATVRIVNDWGDAGTGLLIERDTRYFLVTNKHVLGVDAHRRAEAAAVTLHLNRDDGGGSLTKLELPLNLDSTHVTKLWREHPDADVDVLAFEITEFLAGHNEVNYEAVPFAEVADGERRMELDISIGDDVLVIGYPKGIEHLTSNVPIVRNGIIASYIGDELRVEDSDGSQARMVRGFLVDGAVMKGSSGSAVVLKPAGTRIMTGGIALGESPAVLLGIVAESVHVPQPGLAPGFGGLGFALVGETVREVIELFYGTTAR